MAKQPPNPLWLDVTSLLAVGGVIAAGTLAPAVAVTAAGVITASPAAELLKTVVAGVVSNLASNHIDEWRKRLPSHLPSLKHDDLIAAVGRAIQLYLTVRLTEKYPNQKALLKKLGNAAPKVWQRIAKEQQPAYAAANEPNLPLLLLASRQGEAIFSEHAWRELASAIIAEAKPSKLSENFRKALIDHIARDLPHWFVHDFKEVLKDDQANGDGRQLAAFQLYANEEVLAGQKAILESLRKIKDAHGIHQQELLAAVGIGHEQLDEVMATLSSSTASLVTKIYALKLQLNRIEVNTDKILDGQHSDREIDNQRHNEIMAHLPPSPTSPGFDLEKYRQFLLGDYKDVRTAEIATAGSDVSIEIWRIFVPQKARSCDRYRALLDLPPEDGDPDATGDVMPEKLSKTDQAEIRRQRKQFVEQPAVPVLDLVADPANRRLVILGYPGAGKSMLLNHLALEWARRESSEERSKRPLPILIEFRKFDGWRSGEGKDNFFDYLSDPDGEHRLDADKLREFFSRPNGAICYLDALDEVFDAARREDTITLIKNLARDYPELQIVLTSRPHEFETHKFARAGFASFMLQNFELKDEIPRFLKLFFELPNIVERDGPALHAKILAAIGANQPVRDLAGNPLLLTFICLVGRTGELPDRRVELYEKAAELLLAQWKAKPGSDAIKKVELLCRLAYSMQVGNVNMRGNVIDEKRLCNLFRTYLLEQRFSGDAVDGFVDKLISELRKRNFILAFLGQRHYAFIHRAFLEYFAALYLHEELANNDKFAKVKSIVRKNWNKAPWHEVFRLFAGMQTNPRRAIELIELLLDKTDVADGISHVLLAAELFREIPGRTTDPCEETTRGRLFTELEKHVYFSPSDHDFELTQARAAGLIISARLTDHPARFVREVVTRSGGLSPVGEEAISSLVRNAPSDPETQPMLKELARSGDEMAIYALAEGWPVDPEMLPLLKDLAREGVSAATQVLAEDWPADPEALRLLKDLAQSGDEWAIWKLVQTWPADPESVRLLEELEREYD